MMQEAQPELSVLNHYGLDNVALEPVGSGLINHTWLVISDHKKYILQQVNPMFKQDIHEDIDKVTSYLDSVGMAIPRLVPTPEGKLCYNDKMTVWRLYTCVDGITFDIVNEPDIAYQAGVLLGRFHLALDAMDYKFKVQRPGVHDTARHINVLKQALEQKQGHPRYSEIFPLATEILEHAGRLPELPSTNERKVHGDPKINNFLFDSRTYKGICMLDFDTLSNMRIMLELGDAMRSWCNPGGENQTASTFLLDYFRAGLSGYREGCADLLSDIEWQAILPATLIIYIELSARFCADALNEDYFAWDPDRHASHSEHSQIRAQSQLAAGKSLLEQYQPAGKILRKV